MGAQRPLLIAYDGSDGARAATAAAGALFSRPAVVVNVWQSLAGVFLRTDVDRLTGTMGDAAAELDAADAEAAQARATEGAELARAAGLEAVPVSTRANGRVWRAVLEEGDRRDCAAIVTGTSGLSRLESTLLGSVSHGVLHHATRPVLTVPANGGEKGEGPMLLCYDGSEHAKRAVRSAGELLGSRAALVVTVWRSYKGTTSAGLAGAPSDVVRRASEELDAAAERKAAEVAQEGVDLGRSVGLSDVTGEAVRARPNEWWTIVHTAAERLAPVVVVGSRGRSSVASAALGSVTRGIVTHAKAPVLVVPPG